MEMWRKKQNRKKYNGRKLMENKPFITNQRNKRHISCYLQKHINNTQNTKEFK